MEDAERAHQCGGLRNEGRAARMARIEKIEQRRFAGSRPAEHGDPFARRDREVDVVQHGATRITEIRFAQFEARHLPHQFSTPDALATSPIGA